MAGDEPVTSPDQHKPTNRRLAYLGGIISIAILVLMQFGNNNPGWVARTWLLSIATIIAALIAADIVLHRRGLRP